MRVRPLLALVTVLAVAGCSRSAEDEPSGRILVFDGRQVSAIPVDGGQREVILLSPEPLGGVAYSPDRDEIAYDSDEGLHVANADGSEARRIAGQPTQDDFLNVRPSWSSDGDRLVFDHGDSLYSIAPEGGPAQLLGHGSSPRFGPRGRIVFIRGSDPNRSFADIVVMDADGRSQKVLARGDFFDISPDGTMLAYSGPGGTGRAADNRAVYVIPLDGGERRGVTNDGYAPIWSPDGDFLAFTRITECGHAVCSGRVFITSLSGGETRAVSEAIVDPGGASAWIR